MNARYRDTLTILIESPFWELLTPGEKLRCLKNTEDLLDQSRERRRKGIATLDLNPTGSDSGFVK